MTSHPSADTGDSPLAQEPERYELEEAPRYRFELERRRFLQLFGGGVAVLLVTGPAARPQESGGGRRGSRALPEELSAWLEIAADGVVTVYTGKVEVGQNTRTSLSMAVADELHCDLESVRLVMGDTDRCPFDMGTFGSLSTPRMAPQLRRAAAVARELLLDLAAGRFEVPREKLQAKGGRVSETSGSRSIGFGELAAGQELLASVGSDVETTPPQRWTVTGRPQRKVGGRAFVTGEHRFTADQVLPGMLYGKVLRPPSFGAELASADLSAATAMSGVSAVHDGDFVGVAAPSEREAQRALRSLRAEWHQQPQPSSSELFDHLLTHPREARGFGRRSRSAQGSLADGMAAAKKKLKSRYTVAYIAHTPLEPRAALAEWKGGKLTVWTGTQRPFGVKGELVAAFSLPEDKVRVIVPDTGSGYGGKHTGEAAIEAARLAKAAGRPVKLIWTREEELTWAYFRPAGVIDVEAGVAAGGKVTAWSLRNVNSGGSGIRDRYDFANHEVQYVPADSPLRQGSYRALAATANHFARESHLDELAHAIGLDPLELRRRNTSDERLLAVLEAAAERSEWGRTRPAGRGLGIAGGFEKGSYVATCAEVSVAGGKLRVERVVTAFECGAIVNPEGLEHQVEGSVVMGLGGALFEAIDFADGRIANARLARYRVPRFSDLPELETVLLDRKDLPSEGAGETPIVAVAPAIANALFAATGERRRSLPLAPDGLAVG